MFLNYYKRKVNRNMKNYNKRSRKNKPVEGSALGSSVGDNVGFTVGASKYICNVI